MEKFNPKVSIIIPVYNGENYIQNAIESALSQTYKNIEIIVVNDGSTDEGKTAKKVKLFGDKVKYYSKENGGVASALNYGISKMSGEYFSWLSHDDEYLPEKVEKEVAKLSTLDNKETVICCNVTVISHDNKVLKHNSIPEKAKKSMQLYLAFDQSVGLNGCSLLIKKDLFKKYGNFNTELKVTQDYDMWFRLAKNVPFAFIEDNLVLSRQHDEQGSKTMLKEVAYEVDKLHSRFVRTADFEEYRKFTENISEYFDYYYQYIHMMCYETAIEVALIYIKLLCEDNKEKLAIDFINYNIFNNSELYEINKDLLNHKNKTNKKRILFYNNIWIKGGIERVLSKVLDKLVKDYEIFFVTFNFSQNSGYELPDQVKKIQFSNQLNGFLPYAILFITRFYEIEAFFGNQNLDMNFLPTYKILSENNIKTVAVNHYNYFLPFNVIWLSTVALRRNEYYKYADIVTWATKISCEVYGSINNNSYYLPNPNTFKISKKTKKNPFTIISVARFDDTFKRLDLLLRVLDKTIKELPQVKLMVVGNYDLNMVIPDNTGRTVGELLKELKIPKENLEFVGEQTDVTQYYKKAELYLHTSETEGFGMVLNEAATHGVPSIAFNISGLDDIIISGENGYLVEKYNLEEMKNKIVTYFSDEKQKEKIQEKAMELSKRFDIDGVMKKWDAIFDNLFNKGNYESLNQNEHLKTIVREYEASMANHVHEFIAPATNNPIVKTSMVEKFRYYFKTYGLKATIKKIFNKLRSFTK